MEPLLVDTLGTGCLTDKLKLPEPNCSPGDFRVLFGATARVNYQGVNAKNGVAIPVISVTFIVGRTL
jgi:hypothetical protein